MSAASLAVQTALVAALRGDAQLTNMVSGIFDSVPVEAALPYVTLGGDTVSDASSKTGSGREHRVTINVWDAASGAARVKAVLARVEAAVVAIAGVFDGHHIVSALFLRSFVTRNPDGAAQGVAEFSIRSQFVEGD